MASDDALLGDRAAPVFGAHGVAGRTFLPARGSGDDAAGAAGAAFGAKNEEIDRMPVAGAAAGAFRGIPSHQPRTGTGALESPWKLEESMV